MRLSREMTFSWLLVILLSAFAICPALLYPIEEHSYDAATFHVYRGTVFSAARAEGVLYPRWVQPINAGLGGPLFSFYSPLCYFAMDVLHTLGVSQPVAWRVLVALALVLASMGVFALVLSLSDDAVGAVAASAVYVYSFPLLRDLYERGSPQGFALALYPWVLCALVRFLQRPNGLRLGFAAFAWATMILTHNLSALLLIPFACLVALLFVYRRGWRALWATVVVISCGLLLSSFFIIPFIAERGFVQLANAISLDYTRISQNATPLRELLRLPLPYDIGLDNNLIGDQVGPLQGLIALAGLVAGSVLWIQRRHWEGLVVAGCGAFSLLVMWGQTASADPFWNATPLLAYVQVRMRLLGLLIVSTAIIVGLLVRVLTGRLRTGLSLTLIATSLALAMPVMYPHLQYRYVTFGREPTVDDAVAFSLQENVPGLTAFNEFLPIWRYLPFTKEEAQQVDSSLFSDLPKGGRIIQEERGISWAKAQIESPIPFDAPLHVLYFPGWAGLVDGNAHNLKPIEGNGYILLEDIPAGTHSLVLRYDGTPVQRAGNWISIVSAVALVLVAILWRRRTIFLTATYPTPKWWMAVALVLFVGFKVFFIDAHTTLFRRTSTCSAVEGAAVEADVRFGRNVRLCAFDLQDRMLKPGDPLRITLYWQADEAIQEPADSFVHLLGTEFNPKTGNPLWGQQDKQLPGYHPVTQWTPSKIYRDSYEFPTDPDAPPGEYQLEIGWKQLTTGLRLKPELTQPTDEVSVSHIDSLLISGIELR